MLLTGKRIRKARRLREVTQTELAKMVGTSPSQISMMETNKSGTSLKTAIAVARALDISLDYLAGWVDDPTPARLLLVRLNAKIEDSHEIDRGYTLEPAATLEGPTDFIGITEIDGSAGPGAVVYHEGISSQAKFPRRWLSDHGLTARSCRVIRVKGESMEPTLPNRSLVLVDLASDKPKQHGIFAIRTGDELIVKRLAFDPKVGWLLESDNPIRAEWPTKPWPDDAVVVGEVRWVGRSLP